MVDNEAASLRLWVVMNRALWSIEDRLNRQVEAYGLSMTEFAVLEVLKAKGTLPIGEIGGRILRTSGSMTYVIDKLVKRGLIERQACPTDRRVVHVALTRAGRALIDEVFPEHAALIAALTDGLSIEEKQAAADLVKRLGLHAQAYTEATPA